MSSCGESDVAMSTGQREPTLLRGCSTRRPVARPGDRGDEPVPPPAGVLPDADLAVGQALVDVATLGILSSLDANRCDATQHQHLA
jgi:hypothetical protein